MRGTILQPTYLPWSGFFEMIDATDVFVVYDHVQFARKSWQNRNKIKGPNGMEVLSVPVKKAPLKTPITQIQISRDRGNPLETHWDTIQHKYKKTPHFEKYFDDFATVYGTPFEYIRDLNVELIKTICRVIGIETNFIYSSDLGLDDETMGKTERVVNLCQEAGLTYLYDAKGAEGFLDNQMFDQAGLEVKFQDYTPLDYPQLYGEHIGYLSVIDMLFNIGPETLDMIRAGKLT